MTHNDSFPILLPTKREFLSIKGYKLGLTALLRALKLGLTETDFDQINPMMLSIIRTTYRNTAWGGWNHINNWQPSGQTLVVLQSFIGRHNALNEARRQSFARALAATAAGLRRWGSPFAN